VLVLSGIKIAGVPQATLVIAISLGVFAAVFVAWSVRELFLRRIPAQDVT